MAGNSSVGYGKPPVHTRFRKGQSGNPSGRPGEAKTTRGRLKLALDGALALPLEFLRYEKAPTALDSVVQRAIGMASCGEAPGMRFLFSLIRELEPAPKQSRQNVTAMLEHEAPVENSEAAAEPDENKMATNSLRQGKIQGSLRYYGANAPRK